MTGYLDLPDEQRVFVEEHGGGESLFLLHGGFAGAESWQAQIPALAEDYHVFVPERRGHGRTPDVPGPYTTEVMAAETALVIHTLAQGPAHLVGWSDGALRRGLSRPAPPPAGAQRGADRPGAVARRGDRGGPRTHARSPARRILPGGVRAELARWRRNFEVVLDKIITLWREPLEMPIAELAQITAPVLVMQGDDDGVRIDWMLALARALPAVSSR